MNSFEKCFCVEYDLESIKFKPDQKWIQDELAKASKQLLNPSFMVLNVPDPKTKPTSFADQKIS